MNRSAEEECLPFSKLKTRDIMIAALNKSKSTKMKGRYKRSLGFTWKAYTKEKSKKAQRKAKNEDMMRKYLSKMNLDSFLTTYEKKDYAFSFINKLLARFKKCEDLRQNPILKCKVDAYDM
jgi:hypothetical protein